MDRDDLAVWADQLQLAGDPRGELVATQLAHGDGRYSGASLLREAELLAEHGRRWAGVAGFSFTKHVFRDGLFVGGLAREVPERPDGVDTIVDVYDPVAAVRAGYTRVVLGTGRATVHGLAAELTATERASVIELGGFLDAAEIAALAQFPNLEALELRNVDGSAPWPALPKLRRVTLRRPAAGMIARAQPGWRIEMRSGRHDEYRLVLDGDRGWLIRSEPAERASGASIGGELLELVEIAARAKLRSLEVVFARPLRLPADAVGSLIAATDRMQLAELVAPWVERAVATTGARWHGTFAGGRARLADAAHVWTAFAVELGAGFDRYTVNDRGEPALGPTPVKTIRARARDKKTHQLRLSRAGTPDQVTLRWDRVTFTVTTEKSRTELATWFAHTVEALGAKRAALAPDELAGADLPHEDWFAPGAWIAIGSPWAHALVTRAGKAALAAAGVVARRAGDAVVIEVAPTTPAHIRDVHGVLAAIVDDYTPFPFVPTATKVLTPFAAQLGLATKPTVANPRDLEFVEPSPAGRRPVALLAKLAVYEEPMLAVVQVRDAEGRRYPPRESTAVTKATLARELAAQATEVIASYQKATRRRTRG